MSDTEPDYTITIIERDGFSIVCEGGVEISKPLDLQMAKWWANQHQLWHQPRCCVCGSAITRPDDPWEAYSVSCSSGADWVHKSCIQKLEQWADDESKRPDYEPGPHRVPPMEVLDAAWAKKQRET